ncbi:MAG: hypothetical protein AAGH15_22280, partial [Myxococcota bacterium]
MSDLSHDDLDARLDAELGEPRRERPAPVPSLAPEGEAESPMLKVALVMLLLFGGGVAFTLWGDDGGDDPFVYSR